MPLGNPIRKQNESRMVSVLATEGQTVFTVQGGYIINHISVFRNGVRLSPAEDFTAGDGSTVTLNNAANVEDRIDFHIFDRFTVQNAIVGAASTQTINGDLVLNGKLFGQLDVPSINLTGIITATELDLNGKGDISSDLTVARHLSVAGVTTTQALNAQGGINLNGSGSTNDLTGSNIFRIMGSDVRITNAAGSEGMITAAADGAVTLFHGMSGSSAEGKLATTSGGVTITGVTTTGSLVSSGAISGTTGTFSGDVDIADKIVHTGDTNTAIRFPSADTVTVETGGSERARIDSSGRLMVGHNSSLAIGGGDNAPLQVTATTSVLFGGARYVNSSSGPFISLSKSRAASAGSNTIVQDGDDLGTLLFSGDDGTDLISKGAQISAAVDGTPGSNDMPGRLVFSTTADGAASPTERMRITSTGRVLIGDTDARAHDGNNNPQLQVSSSVANNWARISSTSYINSDIGGGIILAHSRNGTIGSHTVVANGDKLGSIFFEGSDGTDFERGAHIEAFVDAAPGDNDMPGRLVFSTSADGSTSPTERMRITSSGKIGINETAPDTQLHITAASGDTILTLQRSDTNTSGLTGGINFVASDDHSVASIQARGDGDNEGADLRFYTTSDAAGDMFNAANVERMRITSGGKVGIGEDNPSQKLHIAAASGDSYVRTDTTVNGGLLIYVSGTQRSVFANDSAFSGTTTDTGIGAKGNMIFRAGTSAYSERLRIASSGVITNTLATDNTTAVTLRNNGTTGGHALKLTTGGTGAGTHIFTIFSHNQSSENERLRVDANGHLVLGVSGIGNPALYGGRLKVISTAASDAVMNCINTATGGTNRQIDFYFGTNTTRIGSIQSNSSATAYNTSSDYRLKENAVAISDGITRLKTLKPYRFNFKIDASRTVDGFFAHEVTAVPEAITGIKDGTEDILYTEEDTIPSGKKVGDVKETVPAYQEIDQSKLVPLLTAALQEAVAKIETLETKVAALEGS